jgi:excisionase family DNA binding protein
MSSLHGVLSRKEFGVEKVSIARRRQYIRLLDAQNCPAVLSLEVVPPPPPAQDAPALQEQSAAGTLPQLLSALGAHAGAGGSRVMGFALELELDPNEPNRLRVEVIPRPVRAGRFVTVKQAARLLHLGTGAVRRALACGELQGMKIGRQWRVCLERPRRLEPASGQEE